VQVVQSSKPFEVQVLELSDWQERPLQNNFFEVVYIARRR
jgi:hypothetical protein